MSKYHFLNGGRGSVDFWSRHQLYTVSSTGKAAFLAETEFYVKLMSTESTIIQPSATEPKLLPKTPRGTVDRRG